MAKIAFVFPGQGSQYVGMGQTLSSEFDVARETFQEANNVLGFDITQLCFNGPEETLRQTSFTQPAILTHSVALARVLRDNNIVPDVVAGHSLGEYSALVTAGVLSFEDALKLVHIRGKLMEEAFPQGLGAMAAVMGLGAKEMDEVCSIASTPAQVVQAANYNCPGQVVISGTREGVEKASEVAKAHGAKRVMMLNVSGPFHSSLMTKAAENFAQYLNQVEFKEPLMSVIANFNITY